MGLGGQLDNPAVNSMERTPLLVVEKVGLAPRPIWVGVARSDIPTALYRHYTDCTIQTALYRLHYTDCTIPTSLYRLHYTGTFRHIKVTFTLQQAITTHRWRRGTAVLWLGCSTPRSSRFTPEKRTGTHCTGGWVGLGAGLDGCVKSRPHRDSIPGPYNI